MWDMRCKETELKRSCFGTAVAALARRLKLCMDTVRTALWPSRGSCAWAFGFVEVPSLLSLFVLLISYYVILCYIMLYIIMLCYVMLYYVIYYITFLILCYITFFLNCSKDFKLCLRRGCTTWCHASGEVCAHDSDSWPWTSKTRRELESSQSLTKKASI